MLQKNTTIDVLDAGKVTYIEHMGTDLTVVNAARVSFSKHKDVLDDSDIKLIKYLANHRPIHFTPFTHPQIMLRVKAPMFVKNQLFKHKVGFSENEESRRYVSFLPEFYTPEELRSRPAKLKQGSGEPLKDSEDLLQVYRRSCTESLACYEQMIESGVAPEQARGVLPVSMYVNWYWTGSLFAYARMYGLRYHPDAQKETKAYAEAIGGIIQTLYPISWEALTTKIN